MQIGNIWIQDIHTAIEKCWVWAHIDIKKYNLIDKNYSHKDVFNIISHHVLSEICSEIISGIEMGYKTVLYLNTEYDLRNSEYIEYGQDTKRVIERLENIIISNIPAYIIKRPYLLYYDFAKKYRNREVDAVDEIEKIQQKINKNAFKPFNLNKLIKYLDKRGLKYLSSDYFQQANNKLLAANK